MESEKLYFLIDLEHLGEAQLFPFHMHVFNPMTKQYSPYLYANSPLTGAKRELLLQIIEKGGKIAVPMKQKKTLLHQLEITEEQIPDLAPEKVHHLEERRKQLKEQVKESETNTYHFKEQLALAASEDNFSGMINHVREQVIALSPRVSSTTTLASLLAESLLFEDDLVNRTVALSYMLAKGCGITDDEAMGDLVCAAFFSHLGYTQLPHSVMKRAQTQLSEGLKKDWKKHPGLSMHLLRKARIELSERCLAIIEQHHERYDGQGFPQMKKGAHIETLALVLGAASHILEFTSGMVTGGKSALVAYVMNVKNKTYVPGMECEFGPLLEESLAHLVNTMKTESNDKDKKAA